MAVSYTIRKNTFHAKMESAREAALDTVIPGGIMSMESIADNQELPKEVREFAEAVNAAAKQASASKPEHEEYHVEELVTIDVPYNELLHIIYGVQVIMADAGSQAERTSQLLNTFKDSGVSQEILGAMAAMLDQAMHLYMDFAHLGSELNTIRLAAKPLELPECPDGHEGDREVADKPTLGDFNNIGDLFGGNE